MRKKWSNPFDKNPISCCYPYISFPYSIVHAHSGDEYQKWLCGKYINCYFKPQSVRHKFINSVYDGWSTVQKIFFYQGFNLSKEMLKTLRIDIPFIIKKAILDGAYPYGQCSERFVFPGHDISEDTYFDYILTGFDDIRKIFFMTGFSIEHGYRHLEISYSDYVQSLYQNSKKHIVIHLWKYNPNAEYRVDLKVISRDLEDYLCSKNSITQYEDGRLFGLCACSALGEYITQGESVGDSALPLYLRGYWEHKYFMNERIRYLAEENMICNTAIAFAEQVLQLAEQVKVADNGIWIQNLIQESIAIEQVYLPQVLANVRANTVQ